MYHLGPLEIVVVLIIVLIFFGPKRLPELGRSMGKGIRDFRGAMDGEHDAAHDRDSNAVEEKRRELERAKAKLAVAEANAEKPVEGEVVTEHKG
jgi:sec-independent protein translocase protein TatA